jgi:hypothetical protein
MKKFLREVEKFYDILSQETKDFFWNELDNLEERLIKLTGGGKKQFEIYYAKRSLNVKEADVFDLLNDVFEFENKMKEKILKENIMEKKDEGKKVVEAELVTKEKALEVAKKKEALLVKQEMPMSEWKEMVEMLYKSGYFKDLQSVAQAITKAQCGRELGFPPYYSLNNFFILPGKPPASTGQVMAALVKRSGYDYRVVKNDENICVLKFFGLKGEEIGESSFTFTEADKVVMKTQYGDKKLTAKDNWKNYRQDMIFWRAMVRGARRYCPDAIAGLYLKDEIDFEGNEEVKGDSDLSQFKAENAEKVIEKKDDKPIDKTRKEKLDELKKEFGVSKLKILKEKMKIENSLVDIEDVEFEKFVNELKKVEEKPKEKEEEKQIEKIEEKTEEKQELKQEELIDENKKEEEKLKEEKPKKEKVKKMTKEEKAAKIEELKKDFTVEKMKEIKEKMKVEGKLVDLSDKDFSLFVEKLTKGE